MGHDDTPCCTRFKNSAILDNLSNRALRLTIILLHFDGPDRVTS